MRSKALTAAELDALPLEDQLAYQLQRAAILERRARVQLIGLWLTGFASFVSAAAIEMRPFTPLLIGMGMASWTVVINAALRLARDRG